MRLNKYLRRILLLTALSLILCAAGCSPADTSNPTGSGTGAQTSDYAITVTNEQGDPVEGVALQICDDSTCMVVNTDKDGKAAHTGAPYAYEVHVLKVPEGYAEDAETYTLPAEGGALTIVLKKQ